MAPISESYKVDWESGNERLVWRAIKARTTHECWNAYKLPYRTRKKHVYLREDRIKKDDPSDCARLVKPKETYYKWTWTKPRFEPDVHKLCSPCQEAGRRVPQPLLADMFNVPITKKKRGSSDGPSGIKNLFPLG